MKSRVLCRLAGLCLLVLALGCGKSDPTMAEGPLMGANPAMGQPSGNAVFDQHCMKCHTVSAPAAGGPKGTAPNLSKVGAERTVEWLADHVKDPKSHKPGSKMPEFGSKLKPEEIASVSEFMAGLK